MGMRKTTLVALMSGLTLTLLGHAAYTADTTERTQPAQSAPKSEKTSPSRETPQPTEQPQAAATNAPKKAPPADANHVLRLYTDGFAASYLAVPGFATVDMPVRDATDGAAGCYIACSTHERRGSIYAPDPNTYVVGAVLIMGNYQNGVCHPGGQEHVDLASDSRLSELCALAMPKACDRRRCFANGDTGTWVPPTQNVAFQGGSPQRPNGEGSCVLACYSHNSEGALYQVAADAYAVGGFQTGGKYVESVCKPENFEGDLGADPAFKHRCTELFPKQCANDICWPNGNTRGRLGGN